MNLWHLTPDTHRIPNRVSAGDQVILQIGTWPIEPGQSIWVEYRIVHPGGETESGSLSAEWRQNAGANIYWPAVLGPLEDGATVSYTVRGKSNGVDVTGPTYSLTVGPKLYLALMWHQHQPVYQDISHPTQERYRGQLHLRMYPRRLCGDYCLLRTPPLSHARPSTRLTVARLSTYV